MDERPDPVRVQINGTTGLLLLRLMQALGTDDGGSVISRALSLYDMALCAKQGGRRLCLIDATTGHASDVAL